MDARIRRFGAGGKNGLPADAAGRGSVACICDAGSVPGLRIAPFFVLLAVAGALATAGCGGGGRLSHADFVKRADAVCTAFRASTARIARPRAYSDIVAYVGKTRPLYEAARIKLERLRPPSRDEPAVRTWLAADKRISAALRDLGQAALRHDFPGVTLAAGRVQADGVTSRHAAQAIGLQVCSQA
jgi:hypothetical protein